MHHFPPEARQRPCRHIALMPCQVVRERDFVLVAGRIANLSVTGLLVAPAHPVLTGDRLIVSFRSPGWGIWIDSEATVTRVVHGRRQGESSRALGLELDQLNDWSRYVIQKNIRWLPPAPPSPPRMTAMQVRRDWLLARFAGQTAIMAN
jgi:hypothetical protein